MMVFMTKAYQYKKCFLSFTCTEIDNNNTSILPTVRVLMQSDGYSKSKGGVVVN